MRLKIYNRHGNIRFQFDVKNNREAKKLLKENAKATDTGYLFIESSMRGQTVRKRYKSPNEDIVKAENGRILSRAELRKQGFIKS